MNKKKQENECEWREIRRSQVVAVVVIALFVLVVTAVSVLAKNSTSITDLNGWTYTSNTATLTLSGQEILSIVQSFQPTWSMHDAVLNDVYQLHADQAYVGTVVIDSNYIAGMHQYNAFVVGGRAGVSIANNGVILESENSTPHPLCVDDMGRIVLC